LAARERKGRLAFSITRPLIVSATPLMEGGNGGSEWKARGRGGSGSAGGAGSGSTEGAEQARDQRWKKAPPAGGAHAQVRGRGEKAARLGRFNCPIGLVQLVRLGFFFFFSIKNINKYIFKYF
jgi:hypothetical protein